MTKPGADIRKELSDLVKEGELIHMTEQLKTNRELADELEKRLAQPSKSPKGKQSGKGAGSKSKTQLVSGDGSSSELLKTLSEQTFGRSYQSWYSRAIRVVQQILPDRYDEFRELNRLDKQPKELDVTNYSISEYIRGTRVTRGYLSEPVFDAASVALTKFQSQVDILASAHARLDASLADIEGVLEAGLLDDEISTSRELLKGGYLRSAGVLAGVVLERHLKRVVANHQVTFRKKAQIGNLNDALKEASVYDVPVWREIQRLGDIRNLCAHDDERDPTRDEVDELISGVEKFASTVF